MRLTFIPMVQKEYGKEDVLIVKEAIGGRPVRMWVTNQWLKRWQSGTAQSCWA